MASSGAGDTVAYPPSEQELLVAEVSSLAITATEEKHDEEQKPPHRSHNPQFNQKRTDPFQFGSRYLQEEDDVFEFNAWDHVEPDDTFKEYAEKQYAMQRDAPVSDFDKRMYTISYTPTTRPLATRNMMIQSHKHSSSDL